VSELSPRATPLSYHVTASRHSSALTAYVGINHARAKNMISSFLPTSASMLTSMTDSVCKINVFGLLSLPVNGIRPAVGPYISPVVSCIPGW